MNSKAIRKQLLAAVAMVLVAAVALGSSTYAWFVNNAQVTATNVNVTATTAYSLMIKGSDSGDAYGTTKALNDSVTFTPVSTVGKLVTTGAATTATNKYTTVVNELEFFASDAWNENGQVKTFLTAGKGTIADLNNSNTYDVSDGDSYFYYTDTVYLKAGQASKIYLDKVNTGIAYTDRGTAKVLAYGSDLDTYKSALGTTVTSGHTLTVAEEAYDLVKTLRVALVVTQTPASTSTTTRSVYFYELNNGLIDTSATDATSYNTTINSANGLSAGTSGTSSTADYATSDIKNLKNGSIKTIDSSMAKGAPTALASETDDADVLAVVAANEEIQVDIYMWMEGCDYDTTAANSAKFNTTIQGLQFGFCVGSDT